MKFNNNLALASVIIILVGLFFYNILDLTGLRSVIGFIALIVVPTYFILDSFDLSLGEKSVFSFFIGIGIFPSFVYLLGLVMSLKIAILLTFVSFIGFGIVLRRFKVKE